MDCLSGQTVGKALSYMARGGYWVVISTLDGIETTIPLRALLTGGAASRGQYALQPHTRLQGFMGFLFLIQSLSFQVLF